MTNELPFGVIARNPLNPSEYGKNEDTNTYLVDFMPTLSILDTMDGVVMEESLA